MSSDVEGVIPSSDPTPNRQKIVKRKADTPCSSQPAQRKRGKTIQSSMVTALGASVMSLENIQIHNKVDRLLTMMSSFQTTVNQVSDRVKSVEETVNELKLQFITTAPPVNTEVLLEGLKTDIQSLKESLHVNVPVIAEVAESATQEVMMTMGEPEAEIDPDIITPPVTDPVIRAKNVIPNYAKVISKRIHSYYKYLHNKDRLTIHQGWRDRETPFYPPRFVPKKLTHGESEAEYRVRKNQKLKDFESYLEILQIRRDIGKATYESVDTDVQHIVAELDISPRQRIQVIEQYTSKVAAEEVKSQKKWAKAKQGVEGIVDRSADKLVSQDERSYTIVPNRRQRANKPRRREVNRSATHRAAGVVTQTHQQVSYPLVDVSVPPPPFQWTSRTRS